MTSSIYLDQTVDKYHEKNCQQYFFNFSDYKDGINSKKVLLTRDASGLPIPPALKK